MDNILEDTYIMYRQNICRYIIIIIFEFNQMLNYK